MLAYCSQCGSGYVKLTREKNIDVPLVVMIVWLSFFCGLRISFNDTGTYIVGFQNAPTAEEYLADGLNLFGNPLYYLFQSVFRHHISENVHLFLVLIAFFTITSFVCFIRRYADNFTFSILLFFTLGMYLSNFAAMKQCIAMAILMFAVEKLLDRKYVWFYVLVFIAMLMHTYAIMFAILPLFTNKPWTKITYITIAAVAFVLFTFEETITEFLEYADELGKDISETEVFETDSINLFRLAVFSVPPLMSFIFRNRLNPGMNRTMCLMMNMSILSFLVMCLGLNSAANLFGRSAIYFEMGTIIVLPWIIRELFEEHSAKMVTGVAAVCYLAFFMYDTRNFGSEYRAISFMEFLGSLG